MKSVYSAVRTGSLNKAVCTSQQLYNQQEINVPKDSYTEVKIHNMMIWPGSRRHQEQRKQLQRKQKCKLWEKEEVMMLVCIYHPMIYGKTVHWVS